ncbi:MAG: AtpZ/AtpI family protein [Candidatus Devosia symbiotica]|nr:AtpZ/AtpI family protein [Candidatus Devosia symbiotica]
MTKPQGTDGQPDDAKRVTYNLASRIAQAKREHNVEANRASNRSPSDMTGMACGIRIGSEFIAAILVGAGLGYLVDLNLGTGLWGLLILLMVGFAAGILNVIRVVTEMNKAAAPLLHADLSPDADDDDN